jgi:hypothetical protein
MNASLSRMSIECSRIAVEFIVDEYDQAVELGLDNDN